MNMSKITNKTKQTQSLKLITFDGQGVAEG